MLTELGVSAAPCLAGDMQAYCVPCSLCIPWMPLKCKQMSLHGSETADIGEQVKFHRPSNDNA